MHKKGFTIIEVIIIVVLIWLWLITVINALWNSNTYLQKTREKIIAINLAREGIEQVINIRNTNWQKRAWAKEQTRLKTNPSIDEWTPWLGNDSRFWSWNYIILNSIVSGQQYFYASGIQQPFVIESWTSNPNNLLYSLCETWWTRIACPWQLPQSKEWNFFRRIEGKWLFAKDSTTIGGTFLNCPNGETINCWTSSAKEFRFCSTVEYIGVTAGKVELCSVLTNFEK